MTTFSGRNPSHHEPSSDPINDSDEELFGTSYRPHNTVATVPLPKAEPEPPGDSEDEHETIATMPLHHNPAALTQQTHRTTQPTQVLPRASNVLSSSPPGPHVQVVASSPYAISPNGRPPQNSRRVNPMAPAGTAFRQPLFTQQHRVSKPVTINDDDAPTYKGGSSDDDDVRRGGAGAGAGANVKTTNFQRVAESPPAGKTFFQNYVQQFHHGTSNGVKRSGDDMSYAYGNASKRPRQIKPSRAMPVQLPPEREPTPFELDDIEDAHIRAKVRRMQEYVHDMPVKLCYDLLLKHKNFDDAVDRLLEAKEKQDAQMPINLISDDELNTTPATQKNKPAETTKQHAKNPHQTIHEKWGSTQQTKREPKQLDAFSPPEKSKPRRRLVQGRKNRSSPDLPDINDDGPAKLAQIIVLDDSDDDQAVSDEVSQDPNLNLDEKVLDFFNTSIAADIADTASIKPALAQHFVSQQPFRSLAAVAKVDDPTKAPAKTKRAPVGEKIVEKVTDMLQAYDAVDYLVQQCERIAEPLKATMREWGTDITGAGEIEMISMPRSPDSSHDSGIGTPEEGKSRSKKPKGFLTQPAMMNHTYRLNDYQIVGMNWLNLLYQQGLSCILADDMGLGKTYQVIAFLSHLYEIGKTGPHLIVVPAATLENWLMEFKKFSPRLNVEPYYSTTPGVRAEMRLRLDDTRDEVNVVVTTYSIAKAPADAPWLREYGFDCTVFDEGHQLKNADSLVAKKLSRIDGEFRVLLTGTPLQNNLKELMSLLAFMMPDLFYEKHEELAAIFEHTVKTMDDNHDALLSTRRIARARSILTPFILRRKKSQVAKDLPVKTSKVEFCDLSSEQVELYQAWHNKAIDLRARRERGENIGKETTHMLMKLRQAAIHPWLFRRIYKDATLKKIARQCIKDEQWAQSSPDLIKIELDAYSDMEVYTLCAKNEVLNKFALTNNEWLASGKVAKMLQLLREYIAEGSRTLIFSQFTMVLDILEVILNHEQIDYFRLAGSTRVDERQDLIDTFSAKDNHTPVFMLSTKAGGAGINLASANKVIIFDSGFNPQDDIQAENRAHRIGQTKPVEVVRLVSKDTVEEAIYKMGLAKVELDQRVAGGMSGTNTPPNEVQETAAGQELKMTQAEVAGLQMVENMFFDGLSGTDQSANTATVIGGESHHNMAETAHADIPGSTVVDERDEGKINTARADNEADVVDLTRNIPELPDRPKRTRPKSTVVSQSSARSSSSRSSRSSRK